MAYEVEWLQIQQELRDAARRLVEDFPDKQLQTNVAIELAESFCKSDPPRTVVDVSLRGLGKATVMRSIRSIRSDLESGRR